MAIKAKDLVKDRELLQKALKMTDVLTVACGDYKMKEAIAKLKFALSNCSPSASNNVYDADNKIYNKIEDLQIDIAKNKEYPSDFIIKKIEDIKVLIAKRNFTDGIN
ncbi:hypothetical protein EOM82_05455 [bacterium]|nr:hypothetical protein [bacterium]